ncbi:MAG: pyroglutamyl-peptidase I [Verrucomicrobia bacterium]|nr:pyroglutamyl-peptidase I [Verrucomicrobiota bacterium]
MKTVLVTGFEPFGGERLNPSAEIAQRLHGVLIAGHRVEGAVLPCRFGAAIVELRKRIRKTRPVLVVCVGQAGGRPEITPERVAINVDDARIADNGGARPVDAPVVRGGPAAYFSTLPIKAIVAALRKKGVPASVSQTAGTFVCNHVFYGLMHALRRRRAVRGGFIHVPFLPEQAGKGQPSLPLATMVEAITLAVETALRRRRDARKAGGATH